MAVPATQLADAAARLQAYLAREHWRGQLLVGPDPGVRINWRVGRFVKSYLNAIPWRDDLVYMQGQGYWIQANWLLSDLVGDEAYRDVALACTAGVLARQQPEGYWEYPNPEWRGRIATVEGDWATLSLLESYRRAGGDHLLAAAQRWHRYLVDNIGFQSRDGMLAVNYFRGSDTWVPNNSTLMIHTLARLQHADPGGDYLGPVAGMQAFLRSAQKNSGEFPYVVGPRPKPHFLCYQYNAFEFLDLWKYYGLTEDAAILPVMERLAAYLGGGITPGGWARYNCVRTWPEVVYYTAAVSAALGRAADLGLGDYHATSERGYRWVLSQQRPDGSFGFSSRNYRVLADRRSYPRYQAMILYHLLLELQARGQTASSEAVPVAVGSAR